MNFPMTQPIFQFFYWLVNTPGLGGITLLLLIAGATIAAIGTLHWIKGKDQAKESETYSYPTRSLFHDD